MTEPAVLDVQNLVASRWGRPIHRPISFNLARGEHGLLTGANGSGKSTLLRALVGAVGCRADRLQVAGTRPEPRKAWALARRSVRLVPQFPELPLSLFLSEYLTVWAATATRIGAADAVSLARDVSPVVMSFIGARTDGPLGELSFGQRRLVELFLTVKARPVLVLADEPLAGISSARVPQVQELFAEYFAGGGTVLMAVHRPELQHWSATWIREVIPDGGGPRRAA